MSQTSTVKRIAIKQIQCDDPKDLLNIFAQHNEPLIVKGVLPKWPAFEKWSMDYFKTKFAELKVTPSVDLPETGAPFENVWRDYHKEMTVAEFVDFMPMADKPCYIHRQHISKFSDLGQEVGFSEIFQPPLQQGDSFMWIGSGGTRTGLHFDFQDTMLCQFYGKKHLCLLPPRQSSLLYPYHDSITKSRVTPEDPDLLKYPKFANATVYEGTIGPGDMIYMPKHWWHSVVSLEPSISLSHHYGKKLSLFDFLYAINAAGIIGWLTVARDFLWHGLFRQSYKTRLFDDPPFGKLFYDMVAYAVMRRMGSLPTYPA